MKRFGCLLLVIISLLLILPSCSEAKESDEITIDFLDIGKADCILIRTANVTAMIDTGEKENEEEILTFLKIHGVEKIDYLILSHFDKDHIGSAAGIIKSMPVMKVIESTFRSDREEYTEYHAAIDQRDIALVQIKEDLSFKIGENIFFHVYAPKKAHYERKEDNNASLIVEMKVGEKNLLFCGDAVEERIAEFISENKMTYDLIKLPYHGRYLENYKEFLSSTKPKNCIITCSKKNMAADETLDILKENNVSYYLTENGNIQVKIKSDKMTISQ